MKEIRLSWRPDIAHEGGVYGHGGIWFIDTPEIRRALEKIAADENAVHGDGTHWLAEREVDGLLE